MRKIKARILVETTEGEIACDNLVFCSGGNRHRFSDRFRDERTDYDAFDIARRAGCRLEELGSIMRHPFYSDGACIPSDTLYDHDVVDQDGNRLPLTYGLLRAHNAHHRFDDICEEYAKTRERYAVKGERKIPLQVEPHYVLGGIRIDKYGRTNIRNIYALGECSYGMHGAGRLGGCSLSEILVMSGVIERQLRGVFPGYSTVRCGYAGNTGNTGSRLIRGIMSDGCGSEIDIH